MGALRRIGIRRHRPRRARARRGRRRACAQAARAPDGRRARPRRAARRLLVVGSRAGRCRVPAVVAPPHAIRLPRLVHGLSVRFSYRVHSRHPAAFAGDAALDALLSDGSGWSRRLVVVPRRAFQGAHITLAGKLDLDALTRAVLLFEAKTGVHNPAYHLDLAPRVWYTASPAAGRSAKPLPRRSPSTSTTAAPARAPARGCRVESLVADESARPGRTPRRRRSRCSAGA